MPQKVGAEGGVMGGGEVGRKAGQEGGELLPAGKRIGPLGPWDLNICVAFLLRGISEELPCATCSLGKTFKEEEWCRDLSPPQTPPCI